MSECREFYVYALLDTSKPGVFTYEGVSHVFQFEPFYVGKGTDGRWKIHLCPTVRQGNFLKERVINKILTTGRQVTHVKLLTTTDEDLAFSEEERLVNLIGRKIQGKGPLTNLRDGGKCGGSIHISDLTRERMRTAQLGRTLTPEVRDKIAANNRIRRISPEFKSNARLGQLEYLKDHPHCRVGCTHSDDTKEVLSLKRIKYRYVISQPDGTNVVVYNLFNYSKSLGIVNSTLSNTYPRGTATLTGYLITEKLVLPSNWVSTDYYLEYLAQQEGLPLAA